MRSARASRIDGEDAGGDQQRPEDHFVAVGDADHQQGDHVVDDDDRQHEATQAVGEARPDQRQHPQRERGVGRHRHPPAAGRVAAAVEGQVDRDRQRHAAERRQHRQGEAAALAQLADVELAPHLEPDDEEEERHQAAVHPVAQALRDARAAEPDRELRPPDAVVGGEVDVGPDQRRDSGGEQHAGAAGLGGEEVAQRPRQIAHPRGAPAEGRLVYGRAHPGQLAIISPRRSPSP